jgi:hypothetical protein
MIDGVVKAFEQHRQDVDARSVNKDTGRPTIEPEDIQAEVNSFGNRPDVQEQLSKAAQLVADMRDEAKAEVNRISFELIPQRDLATEVRAQRDWARQVRLLD